MRAGIIVDLFWARDPEALQVVQEQYGKQLNRTAMALLPNDLNAEECVNDALLAAWNSIPPEKPDPLLPWLIAVTRNIALRRWKAEHTLKRGGGELALALEELEEVLAGRESVEQAVEQQELTRVLGEFLGRQTPRNRALFLGRYFSGLSWREVGARLGLTEEACKMRASRLRRRLRTTLLEKGVL